MASTTSFYGLQKLDRSEPLSTNDYAFVSKNLDIIDRLMYKVHTAVFEEDTPIGNPSSPLTLDIETTGGGIPAGRTVRYKFTYVDAYGNETAASPEATISTPAPITRPNQPSLASVSTGGTLLSGGYFYILSAYVGVNTSETNGSVAGAISVRSGSTNKIVLTLPTLPSGADGFNIYRRGQGEVQFYYLDSIDMNVATPPTTYEDDGGTAVLSSRTPSATNLTFSTNKITVTLPGATPSVPSGYTWRLYRTFTSGDYNSSLLEWVTTETSFGSGIIVPDTEDLGNVTSIGSPPSVSSITGDVDRIDAVVTAVDALEATLGVNPEGSFDDVADRLDDVDSRLSSSEATVYGWSTDFEFNFNQATVPAILDIFDDLFGSDTDPYIDTDGPNTGIYFPIVLGQQDDAYVEKLGSWGNGKSLALEGFFTFEGQTRAVHNVMGFYDTVNGYSIEVGSYYDNDDPSTGVFFYIFVTGDTGTESYYSESWDKVVFPYYTKLRLEVLTGDTTNPNSLNYRHNVRLFAEFTDNGTGSILIVEGLYETSGFNFDSIRYGAMAYDPAQDSSDIAVFSGKVETKPNLAMEDNISEVNAVMDALSLVRNPLGQYPLQQTYVVSNDQGPNLDGIPSTVFDLVMHGDDDTYVIEAFFVYEAGTSEDITISIYSVTNDATPVDPLDKKYSIVPDSLTMGVPGELYTTDSFVLVGETGVTKAVHLKGVLSKNAYGVGYIYVDYSVNNLVATPVGATFKAGSWIKLTALD